MQKHHPQQKRGKKWRLTLSKLRFAVLVLLVLFVSWNVVSLTGCLEYFPSFDVDLEDWLPELWEDAIIGDPRVSTVSTVIFVSSDRGNAAQRQAIRETWGQGDAVYFVLGQECPYPPHQRLHESRCSVVPEKEAYSRHYRKLLHRTQHKLAAEQQLHQDLILTSLPESSVNIPSNLITAYEFGAKTLPNAQWLVKVNDDMFVRQPTLQAYLEGFDATTPTMIGRFTFKSRSQRPYVVPRGGAHIVSQPVALHLVQHDTVATYDDDQIGDGEVFLDERVADIPNMNYTYALGAFLDYGNCSYPSFAIMGGDSSIGLSQMQKCVENEDTKPLLADFRPTEPQIDDTTDMVALVLTDRGATEQRRAIRETWGLTGKVYFVVDDYCAYGIDGTCANAATTYNMTHDLDMQRQQDDIVSEQMIHQDMIITPKPEGYGANKLREAISYIVQHTSSTKWMLVVRGDSYVRMQELSDHLANYDDQPRVVGSLVQGKENVKSSMGVAFSGDTYPIFPTSLAGFAISRPVAEYVSLKKEKLEEYALEDASLGIWLEKSDLQVAWDNSDLFMSGANCAKDSGVLVIGQSVSTAEMRNCFKYENPEAAKAAGSDLWTDAETVILVMSRRESFEARNAIRDSWASGHDNVFFIVAGEACPYPPYQRVDELDCELDPALKEADTEYAVAAEQDQVLLQKEQEGFQDMILVPQQESYRSLPRKLKEAYAFAIEKTKAKWIIKADDDFFVRVATISEYLTHYDASQPAVLGRIMMKDLVRRKGKWAETDYMKRYYPLFPLGSTGHAVSRPLAEYIATNKETLFEYQGEDTSLGIWLSESGMHINWTRSRVFQNGGKCRAPVFYVIGHRIEPEQMVSCYEHQDESIEEEREKPNWIERTEEKILPRRRATWGDSGGEGPMDKRGKRRAWFEKRSGLMQEKLERKRTWMKKRRNRAQIEERLDEPRAGNSEKRQQRQGERQKRIRLQPPEAVIQMRQERMLRQQQQKRGQARGLRQIDVANPQQPMPPEQARSGEGLLHPEEDQTGKASTGTQSQRDLVAAENPGSAESQKSQPVRAPPIQQDDQNAQSKLEQQLALAPKFPRGKDGIPTAWLPPRLTNSATVVIVMSSRGNRSRRNAIRKAWGKGHDNVYFVVSAPCPFPKTQLAGLGLKCEKRPEMMSDPPDIPHQIINAHKEKYLLEEQETNLDMIYVSEAEGYLGLAHKLKEAYDWVVTHTKANWVVKADDDSIVRVRSIETYLSRIKPTQPTVIGRIIPNSPVQRNGKWVEHEFKGETYPPWPQGSCGHIVSRPVAEYCAKNKENLHEYQGEDISLGIWLDESPLKKDIVFVRSKAFANDQNCSNPEALIVGHDMLPKDLKACYSKFDELEKLPDDDIEPLEQ